MATPCPGASVTFTAPASTASGVFSNSTNTITALTNASGQLSEAFTANTIAGGPYTVTAVVGGVQHAIQPDQPSWGGHPVGHHDAALGQRYRRREFRRPARGRREGRIRQRPYQRQHATPITAARGSQGTASLQGSQLTATVVAGVATFSGLSYNKAETMNITFSTNSGAFTATSNNVVVSPNVTASASVRSCNRSIRRRAWQSPNREGRGHGCVWQSGTFGQWIDAEHRHRQRSRRRRVYQRQHHRSRR